MPSRSQAVNWGAVPRYEFCVPGCAPAEFLNLRTVGGFMRRSVYGLQFLAVAIGFLVTLASVPALAQPATTLDAGVFRNPGEIVPAADGGSLDLITYGSTATFRVPIQNVGPSQAFTVKLTGTAPTGPTVGADGGLTTQITAVTPASCTISADKASFTCNNLGDLPDGQLADGGFTSATLTVATFTVQLAAPAKPYTTTCSLADGGQLEGVLLGPATVTASAVNAPNAMAQVSSTRTRPLADLAVTMTGPSSANQGDTVTFQVQALNNGPCPANRVRLTNGNISNGFIFVSNTGDACINGFPCTVASSWPAGAVANIISTFKVDNVAFNVTQTQLLNEVDIASTATANTDGGAVPLVYATPDPSAANNAAPTNTYVQNSPGGCDSVGAGSVLGLLGAAIAVGLMLKRRRRA
jgi:uncharacterized repeat protein (TIGR01451 family)